MFYSASYTIDDPSTGEKHIVLIGPLHRDLNSVIQYLKDLSNNSPFGYSESVAKHYSIQRIETVDFDKSLLQSGSASTQPNSAS